MAGPVPTHRGGTGLPCRSPAGCSINGKIHKRAEVRELTGVDEEALARYKKSEDIFDAVIARGIVQHR